jgi:hypothetical protein
MMAAQLSNSSPMVRQPLGWPSPLNAVDWPTSQRVAFSCRSPSTIVSQLWLHPDSTAQAPLQCSNKRHQRTISEPPTESQIIRYSKNPAANRNNKTQVGKDHKAFAHQPMSASAGRKSTTAASDARPRCEATTTKTARVGGGEERENKLPDAHTSHLLKSQARKKAPSSSGCSVERVCSRTMYSASRSSSLLMVAFSSTAAASCSPAPPSKLHMR